MVLDGKSSQEYLVNAGEFLKAPFYILIFLLYINFATYADDTTLCSKCDHTSDLLQQQELASEH